MQDSPLFLATRSFTALAIALAANLVAQAGHDDASATAAVVEVSSTEALVREAARAAPGTTILLQPGEYRGGAGITGPKGAPDRPVTIRSAKKDAPARFKGGANGFQLSDAEHVVIEDLVIEGTSANGINIDDGGSFDTPARGIVLRRIHVRDVGPRGNRDGIKLSGVVDFRVEDCEVERWGDGGSGIDMVGCHRGLIEGSVFRHAEPQQANGVQAKGGSSEITIRRCRFEGAGGRAVNLGGSTGREYFRPRLEGYEAKDVIVEDCVITGSAAPVAFVGVDGAVVRHNLIYQPKRWIVRILQESRGDEFTPCRKGRFERNIIVFNAADVRSPINIGDGTDPRSFTFAGNLWFASDNPAASRGVARSLPSEETDGVYGEDPRLADPGRGDFTAAQNGPAAGRGPRPRKPGDKAQAGDR